MKRNISTRTLFTSIAILCFLAAIPYSLRAGGESGESATNPGAATRTIDIEVSYRERIILPPESILTVTLEDVSKMDTHSTVIAHSSLPLTTTPPYSLSIEYDPLLINDRSSYNLRGRIHLGDRLLFISTEHLDPFLTKQPSPIHLLLYKTGNRDIKSNVSVASLVNTTWKLLALNGANAEPGADGRPLSLLFAPEKNRISGYSGCNNFTAGFAYQKDKLHIGQLASTMKMCAQAMAQEQKFLQLLAKVVSYEIEGERLTLYDGAKTAALHFESSYMP